MPSPLKQSHIYLSDDEKEQIKALAAEQKLSFNNYVRTMLGFPVLAWERMKGNRNSVGNKGGRPKKS